MRKTLFIALFFAFINFSFSQNERILSLVKKTDEMNLDMWDLTNYAEKHLSNKSELAKFFYYWIGLNIKYDKELFQKMELGKLMNGEFSRKQDELNVYKNRKGVCAGYANLYKWFMNQIDIETVIISGHIRDLRNHYVELESDDNFRHAWNAIKLDEKWILVDTTWGTSRDEKTSEYFFNIKPEFSIITHFPENSKWQLLKKPLTLEEFNNSQFVKPMWFIIGFTEVPKLMADKEFYYFTFQNLPEKKWFVRLEMSTDNLTFKPITEVSDIKVIDQDGRTYFRFEKNKIPKTAYFKVNVWKYKNEEIKFSTIIYKDIINFKI